MGRIVVFVVLIMSCLITIEAEDTQEINNPEPAERSSCVPGRFYNGPGCSKCYCNENRLKVCGPAGKCKLTGKAPTKTEIINIFNHVNVNKLPALPNQGAQCTPGASYKVDCNRCICLERDSLLCERRLCPSFTDVNRLKATEMSGQPCEDDQVTDEDCVQCSCNNGTTVCEGREDCVPMTKLSNKPKKSNLEKKCIPGKRYRLKSDNRRCHCLEGGKLRCPRVEKFDPAFLKAESKKKCTPGVIYYNDCNMCTCGEGGVSQCTLMTCLKDEPDEQAVDKIEQFDEDFLNPFGRKCTPGAVYQQDCNTCLCTDDYSLECTLIACLGEDDNKPIVDIVKDINKT